jgi:prolyl 4-hydroxylase
MLIKKIVSRDPNIFFIDDFLTEREIQTIIKLSESNLQRAEMSGDKGNISGNDRTNRNCWLEKDQHPVLLNLAKRVAMLMKCNWKHFESYQVIHYQKNQEYKYHFDAWDVNDKAKYDRYCSDKGNRLKTAIAYLNTVEKGGTTRFDTLDRSIKAKKGRIVIFDNLKDGNIHPDSRHAGMPVIQGEKWAFNLWLRERQ